MAQSNQDQYTTPSGDNSAGSQYNALSFLIRQMLGERFSVVVVQVMAVTSAGEITPVGSVDVQPMVNQLDAAGNAYPHGTVHELPFFRLQGGANAIVIDPQVGDIGLALISDRDISSVKSTKAIANPGSMRRADMADGMYLGGFLNDVPAQYVQFSAAGIKLHSPTAIVLDAPDIQLIAPTVEINASTKTTITTPQFVVNGAVQFTGSGVTHNGKNIGSGHMHSGVSRGGSNTDAVV